MSREIMQQALDYIKETYDFCVVMQQPKEQEEQLVKALEAALAQPEQSYQESMYKQIAVVPTKKTLLPTQPEQESISTNDHLCAMLRQVHDVLACTALPMKRPWVGLTDEEVNLIYAEPQTHVGQYAKAIEAKLKEKNCG